MEEKRSRITQVDGELSIEHFDFVFTEGEKAQIKNRLKSYKHDFSRLLGHEPDEEEKALLREQWPRLFDELSGLFLSDLERYCSFFMTWVKKGPNLPEHIEKTRDLLSLFRKANRELKGLYMGQRYIPVMGRVDEFLKSGYLKSVIIAKRMVELAKEASDPLGSLIIILQEALKDLEGRPRKTGRRTADLNSGMVEKIGELLQQYFRIKLTAYSGGPFAKMVYTVFEIMGMQSTDISRLLKSAVKNLSK
jgi:hypothetical protein